MSTWHELINECWLQSFKIPHVIPCSKDLPKNIRCTIINKQKTTKLYKVVSKNLSITILIVCNVIKEFVKHGTGGGSKWKIDERSLHRLDQTMQKNTVQSNQSPEIWYEKPGVIVFIVCHMAYTKSNSALLGKVKENPITKEKT